MKQFDFMSKVRINVPFILFFVTALSIYSCSNNHKKKGSVSAAYVQSGYYLPFLIIEEDSLFEKQGYSFELKKFNDNSTMINSFINGNLDITAQSSFTMFPVDEQHPNTYKFIYGQYSNSYFFIVPTNSPIKSFKDIKGDTIGIWKSPTAEAFVKIILNKEGLVFDTTYHIKRFLTSDISAAIENNLVKILFGFDVPLAKLVASGKYIYLEPDAVHNIMPEYKVFNGGGIINNKLINDDPDKARVIKKVFYEALKIIKNDNAHAMQILSRKLNVTVDVANKTLLDIYSLPNDSLIKSATATYKLLYDNKIASTLRNEKDVKNLFW